MTLKPTLPIFALLALLAVTGPATAADDCVGPDCPPRSEPPRTVGNVDGGYPLAVAVRLQGGKPKYIVRYSEETHDWSNITEYAIETDLTRAEYRHNIRQYGVDTPGMMTNVCPGAHAMADDGTREYWIVIWVNKDNTLLPCIGGP